MGNNHSSGGHAGHGTVSIPSAEVSGRQLRLQERSRRKALLLAEKQGGGAAVGAGHGGAAGSSVPVKLWGFGGSSSGSNIIKGRSRFPLSSLLLRQQHASSLPPDATLTSPVTATVTYSSRIHAQQGWTSGYSDAICEHVSYSLDDHGIGSHYSDTRGHTRTKSSLLSEYSFDQHRPNNINELDVPVVPLLVPQQDDQFHDSSLNGRNGWAFEDVYSLANGPKV
jgi:hypothetical protein